MLNVLCDYCQQPASLVNGSIIYPHRVDLKTKMFWRCIPCKAHVGCHPNNKPLGRLANYQLRAAKMRAHATFDPIWKTNLMTRKAAYQWLASSMGMTSNECHIGKFDLIQCDRVLALAMGYNINANFALARQYNINTKLERT